MSRGIYDVIDGATRKVKKQYGVVEGVTRKIKKSYVVAPSFFPRALPEGYTQVEYIESTGTQYIDTGFAPNENSACEVEMAYVDFSNDRCGLFGAAGEGGDDRAFEVYRWDSNTNLNFANTPILLSCSPANGDRMIIKMSQESVSITFNGVAYSGTPTVQTFTSPTNFVIFALNRTGNVAFHSRSRLYAGKLWDNGTLIRDYVPCINSNGTPGLYDLTNGVFYGNAGTDAFAAGSMIKYVTRLCYESIEDISSAVVTLASGTLTYNGLTQTKKVTSVVLDGVTLVEGTDYTVSGNTGTNAGNYTLTVTGIGDYGGTATATWSIAKATGSISVSPTSLAVLGPAGTTTTATITYTGDGTITVSSNATSKATVTRSDNTITVKSVATGSATITVSMAASTNYTAASCTLNVTVVTASTVLAENTWTKIAEISAAGLASEIWKVGDTKTETLNGTSYTFRIVGFNHDDLNSSDAVYGDSSYNGGKKKAGITFEMAEIYASDRYMNSSDTTVGGWDASHMRNTTMPAMKGYMPTALQNVLRTVSKLASAGNLSTTIITSADQLFLLSEIEVFGTPDKAVAGEGSQYSYYKAGNRKVKNQGNSVYFWWLRSSHKHAYTEFLTINTYGIVNGSDGEARNYRGVSFGFCI